MLTKLSFARNIYIFMCCGTILTTFRVTLLAFAGFFMLFCGPVPAQETASSAENQAKPTAPLKAENAQAVHSSSSNISGEISSSLQRLSDNMLGQVTTRNLEILAVMLLLIVILAVMVINLIRKENERLEREAEREAALSGKGKASSQEIKMPPVKAAPASSAAKPITLKPIEMRPETTRTAPRDYAPKEAFRQEASINLHNSKSNPPEIPALRKPSGQGLPPDLTIALIGGKYRIIREIGHGGMSRVYEAEDVLIGKHFALKKMRDEISRDSAERIRFIREAKITAALKHPNIVDIYTILDDNGIYLVFELVEGRTLTSILAQYGKLSLQETASIAKHVINALEYAHSNGVVHRDLKPSNIMIGKDGMVRVMDFGIATPMRDADHEDISGTAAYMAPEQATGQYDQRTDIYALGVTIYEMLTGKWPFPGPDFQAQKMGKTYVKLKDILPKADPLAEEIISKCLEQDPAKRYSSVAELRAAILPLKKKGQQ